MDDRDRALLNEIQNSFPLVSRPYAQLAERLGESEDAVIVIGPYSFRPSARLLVDRLTGHKIPLTGKEAGILKFLYRAGERADAASNRRAQLDL